MEVSARPSRKQEFKFIRRNGLTLFPVKDLTRDQWLALRKMGGTLGGSDVGTILGWNKRFPAIRLFYQKLGLDASNDDNVSEPAFWGTTNESAILAAAQYYDFTASDPNHYIVNKREGIMHRTISPFKYSVRNPKYPFANANVDGLIDFDKKKFFARRIAEAKAISRQSMEMWETIPPYHIGQVMLYMTVLEPMLKEQVAEIYYLIDGNKLVGYEIENSKGLRDTIIENCEIFYAKVQRGMMIMDTESNLEHRQLALEELEPDPDDTLGYEQFLSELYKKKSSYVRIEGNKTLLETAMAYREIARQEKELKLTKQLHRNNIWQALYRNNANVIDFGPNGRITYSDKLYVNVHQ